MKQLLTTAANFFSCIHDGKRVSTLEIAIAVTEPNYVLATDGQVIRSQKCETFRFVASPEQVRNMATSLLEWADECEVAVGDSKPEEILPNHER